MSLNPDKSPGQDQIHPRVLKEVSGPISVSLSQIFRKSLENGRLPEQWKEANVTPIFKKGSRKEPGNYRPISLTSVPRKVMQSFIRCSLGSLLTEAQYGFLPKESCEAQLLSCMEAWTDMMEHGVPSIGLILGHAGNFVPPWKKWHNWKLLQILKGSVLFFGMDGLSWSWRNEKHAKIRIVLFSSFSRFFLTDTFFRTPNIISKRSLYGA